MTQITPAASSCYRNVMKKLRELNGKDKSKRRLVLYTVIAILLLYLGFHRHQQTRVFRIIQAVPETYDPKRIATFQSLLISETSTSTMRSHGLPSKVEYVIFTPDQQRQFLYMYGYQCDEAIEKKFKKKQSASSSGRVLETVLQRYDTLSQKYEDEKRETSSPTRTIPYVQTQLWKYCAFSIGYASAFIDYDGVHLIRTLGDLLEPRTYERRFHRNFMVRLWDIGTSSPGAKRQDQITMADGDTPKAILTDTHIVNDAFIILDGKSSSLDVSRITLRRLLKAPYDTLISSMHSFVLWHNQQLYDAVVKEMKKEGEKKFKKSGIKRSTVSTWEWLDAVCSPSLGNPEDASIHVIASEGQLPRNISLVVASSTQAPYPFMTNISSMLYLSQLRDTAMVPTLLDREIHNDYMNSGLKLTQTHHTPLAYSMNLQLHCPRSTESPCCEVRRSDISRPPSPMESEPLDLRSSEVVFFLRHPLAPPNRRLTTTTDLSEDHALNSTLSSSSSSNYIDATRLRLPYLHEQYHRMGKEITSSATETDVMHTSFISILREKILIPPPTSEPYQRSLTPNFLQLLLENDCVPSQRDCQRCLKQLPTPENNPKRFGCKGCEDKCGCLCNMLCSVRSPTKRVVKEVEIYPPVVKKAPTRLIPKIIHQTWFEQVNSTKYPKMSRMTESWKQDGWEYRFYDDTQAAEYIKLHFPKEFIQAYDALLPGAFKADFFRYCVLLIDGGVYADIDILLTSNLDKAIDDDVGFMLPIDYPGRDVGHGSCLWNGFLAAAPGHPILAKTLEFSVNMIRNRFTSVDVYDMLCPTPIFNVCDGFVLLYYTGPCMLGMSLNAFLGRDLQAHIATGEVDLWEVEKKKAAATDSEFYISPTDSRLLAVGKIVVLDNLLDDLGAHRFVWKERNMLVCATDMPDSDDRPKNVQHYSKSRMYHGVYGVKRLFADSNIADENIRVVVKKS